MDVVSDEGSHPRPIELMMVVLHNLGDAGVSSQVMVVVGVQDVQSDILIVGDICRAVPCSEGSCHIVRATKGQKVKLQPGRWWLSQG